MEKEVTTNDREGQQGKNNRENSPPEKEDQAEKKIIEKLL
jgi:hypothetical protein